jgi:hypothetical protein
MEMKVSKGSKPQIANYNARQYVQNRKVFMGSNTFAEWYEQGIDGTKDIVKRYVVYSYRYDFPLFVWDELAGQWFENATKYSMTTSKHKSQLHPLGDTVKLCLEDMLVVRSKGIVGLVEREVV